MTQKTIIIGTRGSPLALWQANFVKNLLLEEYADLSIELKIIKTTGDKIDQIPLAEIGGKALFLKEIEEQLLDGNVHLAVHSMKDVPTVFPKGLRLAAVLKREDPRDVMISHKYASLAALPKKAVVGTSSLRRKAQLKNWRSDLEIVPIRGNVDTRLKKLETENMSAIILASAGMTRLGLSNHITEYINPETMLPAVAQGAIGIEVREKDEDILNLVKCLNHRETEICVTAERSFLKTIEGDCQSPVAAHAVCHGETLKVEGMVSTLDGYEVIKDSVSGSIDAPGLLGEQLARKILSQGGDTILERCRLNHYTKS
ncbi:MAG: hydroxymethylbilane synthase [Deltaproteobacteria bacterium]|nr:MAG: hydroxymethylbilane synthase [Deltaproteobacteria bacterium]